MAEKAVNMIKHIINMNVPNAKAEQFYNFMINPETEKYKQWLPDEHFEFYFVKKSKTSPLNDLVYFDEILGTRKHRLKFYAKIVKTEKLNKVVFQMKKFGIKLPAFLDLEFANNEKGLALRHEVRIGWKGLGKIIDPLVKIFYNKLFFKALESHCHREWPVLADIVGKGEITD